MTLVKKKNKWILVFKTALLHFQGLTVREWTACACGRSSVDETRGTWRSCCRNTLWDGAVTEWRPQPDQSNPIFLLRLAPHCSGALTALVATPAAPHSWPHLEDLIVKKFLSPFFHPKPEFKGSDDVRELMNGADGTGVVSPENETLTYLRSGAWPSRE